MTQTREPPLSVCHSERGQLTLELIHNNRAKKLQVGGHMQTKSINENSSILHVHHHQSNENGSLYRSNE